MLLRIILALIVILAIAVGVAALVLPRDEIVRLVVFREFFDVSLPILAFGALLKYLCTCARSMCKCDCHAKGCEPKACH